TAFLKDVEFENGVIEVDMAVSGARSYPGIVFRADQDGNWERVYIRPHRSGCVPPSLYSDVLQYVPAFNRVDSWQLYNGEGCTTGAVIPLNRWFHVKIKVCGVQARVYIDDAPEPALRIHDLKHGIRKGSLGLMGPMDGSAYFSNFSCRPDDSLSFDEPSITDIPPGIIRRWQISQPLGALKIDLEKSPAEQNIDLTWTSVTAQDDGLVDLSRYYARSGQPDAVFARTNLHADGETRFKMNFGYSDYITIFLNNEPVFSGNSAYRSRDPSFLGIVGFFDTIQLPLKKGDNEVLFLLAEVMGGWGFKAQNGDAVYEAPGAVRCWESEKELLFPESAAYDPVTDAIYVSNYDPYRRSTSEGLQCISKFSTDGKVANLKWVGGLKNPTGVTVYHGKLYVAERKSLVEIDIAGAIILKRYDVPAAGMLNDVASDGKGTLYITDSMASLIYKFAGGIIDTFYTGAEVNRPNGICVDQDRLIWGNIGDNSVMAMNLINKGVERLTALSRGTIDGVVATPKGELLISHNEGRLFRLTLPGQVSKLLDLSVVGTNIADFCYISGKGLLVIPTFSNNRLIGYKLERKDGK
ncbi:hypothetical protein JXO59_15205, partial [candidate division KSB1 bacterium]|nr:hypothetical protein [candidate division KSB1 bacterium]